MPDSSPLLVVEDLKTHFFTRRGITKAVDGVSFTLHAGETLALVGESGSGKSVTCLSLVRLVPEPAGRIVGGRVLFEGDDLLRKTRAEMRRVRGKQIAMVLQDPMTSLNPALTIGTQVSEVVRQAVARRPITIRGVPLTIQSAAQVSANPPTFGLWVNRPDEIHFSYERYLAKSLRLAFGFSGSPIRLSLRRAVGPKGRARR